MIDDKKIDSIKLTRLDDVENVREYIQTKEVYDRVMSRLLEDYQQGVKDLSDELTPIFKKTWKSILANHTDDADKAYDDRKFFLEHRFFNHQGDAYLCWVRESDHLEGEILQSKETIH